MSDRHTKVSVTLEAHPSVVRLATAMQAKLDRDTHKPDWRDFNPGAFVAPMLREVAELLEAHPAEAALSEAADVANFAMFFADALTEVWARIDRGEPVDIGELAREIETEAGT